MRIGIVGGVEKLESQLRMIALQEGHELEFHRGQASGPGSAHLRAVVSRSELVVILTEVNSHAAVLQARALARRSGTPVRILRRLSVAQLRVLLN